MNYLAHAYLSFNRPGLLVGNMISDFIKGKKKFDYPPHILAGIEMHRAIDDFTDRHAVTKNAKQIFKAAYGLYSGAFMDIVYDYFIANDGTLWQQTSLHLFSQETYNILDANIAYLPPAFIRMFPSMKKHNWLLNYQYETGIERSFEGLVYRASYMSESTTAFLLFLRNRETLKQAYESFFPDLVSFTLSAITDRQL
jgi:acyl carrier protein phosphodiesterase